MTEVSMPSSVDYTKNIPQLPENTSSTLMSVQSTNGISFAPSQVIQFDLPSRAGLYLDPRSVFIRYKVTYTSGATAGVILRKPVYTNFARLDEFIGSVPVNSVSQYNQVANMWVDTNFSLADVYGQQTAWGLDQATSFADVDGVTLTASADTSLSLAAPLVCSFLNGCDKLIPLGAMAPIRIQLTVDTIANIASVAANVTAISIVQPEICFSVVDMGSQVDAAIMAASPKIYIKSEGWANSAQGLATATSGSSTLVFNHRYESIENLYLLSSSTGSKGLNKWGDSFNVLGTSIAVNGSVQLTIANQQFPQLPINNSNGGLSAVLQYLRQTVGSISDQRNTMCITKGNFNYYAGDSTPSTADLPAKFIVGFPVQRLAQSSPYKSSSLMSGVSAASTPINVLLQVGTAFNTAFNFNLIAQYTCLVEIDTMTKQVRVIC